MYLFEDPAYYIKSYNVFQSRLNKLEIMKELTQTVFVKFVVENLKTQDNKLRTLGVGSSSGHIETALIERLLDRFPDIENTVVEPSEDAVTEYKRLVNGKFENVEYTWLNMTFEQFCDQLQATENKKKFHHISAIDCMYHLDNFSDALTFLYDKLEEGGIMLIAICSAENGMHKAKVRYSKLPETCFITSTDIMKICHKNKIPYQRYHHACHTDITGLYSSDTVTEEEKLLLDFWIQVKGFKESVTESAYKEAINFIKSPDCSVERDGKLLLKNDFDLLFIQK
ncbi:histamine N-methyltransferase-like [Anneissia japonica]|uniref:histamine N-methyltransferase-like n=1 Tax=Anneissia japonica TaxID=1529436 RepID=UPI0014257F3C|nr:histamine N-methyltransferase-like [Anneissia japonica]